MAFQVANHNEGDLSLVFQSDHTDIYTLSFTIGPGGVAGLDADHAMYIGRLQGTAGELQLIKETMKDCQGISPAALLLAATGGGATALELGGIVGIGANVQISARAGSRPAGLGHGGDGVLVAAG